jgi:hypothetical protein
VIICVLWWGIYFGCFGAWLGAVIGMLISTRAAPFQVSDRAGVPALRTSRSVPTSTEVAFLYASDQIRIGTLAGQPPYRPAVGGFGEPLLE